MNWQKINVKKNIFSNILKHAEEENYSFCVETYIKNIKVMISMKLFEVLSRLKNEKLNIENESVENCKKMDEDCGQDYDSITAQVIIELGI